jgi:hypothetical protein
LLDQHQHHVAQRRFRDRHRSGGRMQDPTRISALAAVADSAASRWQKQFFHENPLGSLRAFCTCSIQNAD